MTCPVVRVLRYSDMESEVRRLRAVHSVLRAYLRAEAEAAANTIFQT